MELSGSGRTSKLPGFSFLTLAVLRLWGLCMCSESVLLWRRVLLCVYVNYTAALSSVCSVWVEFHHKPGLVPIWLLFLEWVRRWSLG